MRSNSVRRFHFPRPRRSGNMHGIDEEIVEPIAENTEGAGHMASPLSCDW